VKRDYESLPELSKRKKRLDDGESNTFGRETRREGDELMRKDKGIDSF